MIAILGNEWEKDVDCSNFFMCQHMLFLCRYLSVILSWYLSVFSKIYSLLIKELFLADKIFERSLRLEITIIVVKLWYLLQEGHTWPFSLQIYELQARNIVPLKKATLHPYSQPALQATDTRPNAWAILSKVKNLLLV